jgi:UDPglucose 6-dehydrogenase
VKRVAVVGAGRVGLVTAACFARLGNQVTCIERNPWYLQSLQNGSVPFFEPHLCDIIRDAVARGALSFSTSIDEGIRGASVIVLAIGTPQNGDGSLDVTDLLEAAEQIGRSLTSDVCVVSKSTVPAGTSHRLVSIIRSAARFAFRVVMVANPEFLREGSAVEDFLKPDRIVVGVDDARDADLMKELYGPLGAPIVVTGIRAAELVKSVSNFYLALRVSFANEVADLCEALQIDVLDILQAVGMDARIGCAYLRPGPGFGGPCLPKDLRGLAQSAARVGVETPLIEATLRVNDLRIVRAISALSQALGGLHGRSVAVLGLSFKPGTDDTRCSPSLRLIEALVREGATVRAHDPIALDGVPSSGTSSHVRSSSCVEEAVRGADAVAIMTAWPEYKELSLAAMRAAMRGDLLFDGANLFAAADVIGSGLRYRGVGRVSSDLAEPRTRERADVSA